MRAISCKKYYCNIALALVRRLILRCDLCTLVLSNKFNIIQCIKSQLTYLQPFAYNYHPKLHLQLSATSVAQWSKQWTSNLGKCRFNSCRRTYSWRIVLNCSNLEFYKEYDSQSRLRHCRLPRTTQHRVKYRKITIYICIAVCRYPVVTILSHLLQYYHSDLDTDIV